MKDLTILVGPNGAGKSNFIEALRLICDALNTNLESSMRSRGGISEVRRRSAGHPTHFAISVRLDLGGGRNAHYALRVGSKPEGAFTVQREQATISADYLKESSFHVENGEIKNFSEEIKTTKPKISADRLFLTAVSGILPFRDLFDALSGMRFYSINPELIKELQVHDSGERLERSGWNLAAVIKRLGEERVEDLRRIEEYMRQIVPGITKIEHKTYGPRETLEFRQSVQGQENAWRFYAANMSDGTLRSLGVLTALFHPSVTGDHSSPFVAIEEPEITIHPGAASVIMDALLEASKKEQVLATTHSPDLLDHPDIASDSILSVQNNKGDTHIVPVDAAARSAIRDSLYTVGELLRSRQLSSDNQYNSTEVTDKDLFGPH